jgi:hypothetical protein
VSRGKSFGKLREESKFFEKFTFNPFFNEKNEKNKGGVE